MKKRWFKGLLAVVLLVSMLPLQAVAEEKDPALTASKSFVDESLMTDRTNYYNFLKTILPAIELEEKRMENNESLSETDQRIKELYDMLNAITDHINKVKQNMENLVKNWKDPDANWMSFLSGERYINEINIPGTHDAGMNNPECIMKVDLISYALYEDVERLAKTQTTYIDEQLDMGIRSLDIRLHYRREYYDDLGIPHRHDDKSNLWVIHGKNGSLRAWAQNREGKDLRITQVIQDIKTFLTEHPSETIILYLRPEEDNSDKRLEIMKMAKSYIISELKNQINPSTGKPFLYTFPGKTLSDLTGSIGGGLIDTTGAASPADALSALAESIKSKTEQFRSELTAEINRKDTYPQLKDCRGQVLIECSYEYGMVGILGGYLAFDPDHMTVSHAKSDEYELWGHDKVDAVKDYYKAKPISLPVNTTKRINTLYDMWLNGTDKTLALDPIAIARGGSLCYGVNGNLFGDSLFFGSQSTMQYRGWVYMDDATEEYAKYIWSSNFMPDDDCCIITVKSGRTMDKSNNLNTVTTYVVPKGTKITIPGDIYTHGADARNYELTGWKADNRIYAPGDTYTVNGDVTFIGQWFRASNNGFGFGAVPKTGDSGNPVLWIGLVLLGLAGISGTMAFTRRKKAVR